MAGSKVARLRDSDGDFVNYITANGRDETNRGENDEEK